MAKKKATKKETVKKPVVETPEVPTQPEKTAKELYNEIIGLCIALKQTAHLLPKTFGQENKNLREEREVLTSQLVYATAMYKALTKTK